MKRKVLLVLLFFHTYYCLAQQKDSSYTLAEVFVTATRKEISSQSVPYANSKLKANTISSFQFRTTPEALAGQAGVFIQKTNHGGGSPFIRGFTGNQTLLLLDGVRINNSTFRYGPNQYFNTIDVFSVSAIEVLRGSGSVQYGSDAIGGVVQVFSKTVPFAEKKKWFAELQLRGVSRNTDNSSRIETGFRSQKLVIQGGLTARNFGDLPGGDSTGIQQPSGYTERDYDIKLNWKPTEHIRITALHQQVLQKDVPLYHRVKLENFNYYFFSPQKRQLSYIRTDINTNHNAFAKLSFTASYQQQQETRSFRRNGNINRFEENDKVQTVGLSADIFSSWSPTFSSNSGVEFYKDQVNSNRIQTNTTTAQSTLQRGLYPDGASMGNFSIYSLQHVRVADWFFEAGLRYNAVRISLQDTVTILPNLGAVEVKPASVVANISVLRMLGKSHTVYASFSTGYRSPNIDDMGTLGLVDFRYEVPAYSLSPEKSYNTELGYRYHGKKLRVNATVFYMHLNNLITRVQVPAQQIAGYNVYIKENTQESYVRGFELESSWQLSKSIMISMNGTYTYGQNTTRNEPMRRIPPFFGRVLISKSWGKFTLNIDQTFAGKQARLAQGDKDDNRIPVGGTPGWYLINMMTTYEWLPVLGIQFGWINVLNKDYRMHGSGINGQGSTLSFGMRWGIGIK